MTARKATVPVRIGGASAFWGDSVVGPLQLAERGQVDYLIFDYLAETTMAILAAARLKDPNAGYATDFVDVAMRGILREVSTRGIRVLANAGGINPAACRIALLRLATELGVELRVAVVEGDDVTDRLQQLGATESDGVTPTKLPERLLSANAYLGAFPVARALAEGADVVITGRCVDSALTLGPLIHEFDWQPRDFDLLAAGSLAGHILECGCQATGGLFTDWEAVPNWANSGYPILECSADGSFVVGKPAGTGGLVVPLAVTEQLVYEIGDPAAYLLPDVICDFTGVTIDSAGPDRVRVAGARGRAPTDRYKVSATYRDGYRTAGTMIIIGIDAAAKARRTGEAILARVRELLRRTGLADFRETLIEVIGAETMYPPHVRRSTSREVMMRVAVVHDRPQALEIFGREIAASGTSWSPGTTMPAGPRPRPSPYIRQFNCLIPKSSVEPVVRMGGQEYRVATAECGSSVVPERGSDPVSTEQIPAGQLVPLVKIACARSGDKGDRSNIGIIARRPEYLPLILAQVTPAVVAEYFSHLATGPVRRYLLPGVYACNFTIDGALAGGGTTSLRMDPLGKGMAQMLLDLEVSVPPELLI
ncbi:MAG: DUF1446 domain-containing protein [Proteobacteria bacterium]|nr:DUF1446 domain-containing protein [Pseudomonadota bacterium]